MKRKAHDGDALQYKGLPSRTQGARGAGPAGAPAGSAALTPRGGDAAEQLRERRLTLERLLPGGAEGGARCD